MTEQAKGLIKLGLLGLIVAAAGIIYAVDHSSPRPPKDVLLDEEAARLSREKGSPVYRVGPAKSMTADEFLKGAERERREEDAKYKDFPVRLSITIYAPIGPLERGERFEDPLQKALGDSGAVLGGASAMAEVDGKMVITDIGISVRLRNLEQGLPIVRRTLVAQGAPRNTKIEQEEPQKRVFGLEEK